jgi:hypothetical protein
LRTAATRNIAQSEVAGRVRQIEDRERQRHRHQPVADGGDGPARPANRNLNGVCEKAPSNIGRV